MRAAVVVVLASSGASVRAENSFSEGSLIKLIEHSLFAPHALLAFEEAVLDHAEACGGAYLHFWSSSSYFVTLGYSKRMQDEVHLAECAKSGIQVLRRTSGGGTVLQGPGCFNYSLVLPVDYLPEFSTITGSNCAIMRRQQAALSSVLQRPVQIQGHTDLTLGQLKFSGNAQRRKKNCLLFHGSILLSMDLELIERALKLPEQQPEYRERRSHGQFLVNIGADEMAVCSALRTVWNAETGTVPDEVFERTKSLVRDKYASREWTEKW